MRRILLTVLLFCSLPVMGREGGVVSLLPSITDMVMELGAADQLTGVTRYCIIDDRPGLTRLGGMYDLNVEALVHLKPRLVLAYRGSEQTLAPLIDNGTTVRYFAINTLKDVLETYLEVGALLGKKNRAREQVDRVEASLRPVSRGQRPVILVIMGEEGLERGPVYAAGRCIYGEIITRLGGTNPLDGAAAYPSLGREALVTMHPDLTLLITEHRVTEPADTGMLSLLRTNDRPVSIINVYGETALHPGPSLFQLIPMIRNLMESYAADPGADLSKHLVIR